MSINTNHPGAGLRFAALLGMLGADTLAMAAKKATLEMPFRLLRGRQGAATRRQKRAYADRMRPHSSPMVIAICRAPDGGRRYHQCATRDQAIAHGPYLIEHVNGWGQVTRRERSKGAPGRFE